MQQLARLLDDIINYKSCTENKAPDKPGAYD